MNEIVTSLSKQEMSELVKEAIRAEVPNEFGKQRQKIFIKGIHELAEFIRVSPATAQKLRNEKIINPIFEEGRVILFDSDSVLEDMKKYEQKKKVRHGKLSS